MSVYASKRKESKVEFLRVAQDLTVYTARQIKKFPKAQRFIFADEILRLSIEIHDNIMRANSIYVHKGMSEMEFNMRREYLIKARSAIFSMSSLLTVTLTFLLEGNNFFGSKEDAAKVFEAWAEYLNKESVLIKAVMTSDIERYRQYTK